MASGLKMEKESFMRAETSWTKEENHYPSVETRTMEEGESEAFQNHGQH